MALGTQPVWGDRGTVWQFSVPWAQRTALARAWREEILAAGLPHSALRLLVPWRSQLVLPKRWCEHTFRHADQTVKQFTVQYGPSQDFAPSTTCEPLLQELAAWEHQDGNTVRDPCRGCLRRQAWGTLFHN